MSNNSTDYYVHISSKHKLLDFRLKETWQYRDLILLFTQRSFQLSYKQTILGPLWIFINPFITSIVFTLVFGGIAKIDTNGIPHILFYLCSNGIWSYFASCVTSNARVFIANANVFGKVYFPRLTVPLSNMLSSIIHYGIQLIMLMFFLLYYVSGGAVHPNWMLWCMLPALLLQLGLLGVGIGVIISSLTTKYRDLSILVGFGVQLWMYASPIVYPLSQIQDRWIKMLLMINPVTAPVEAMRLVILGVGTVSYVSFIYSCAMTAVVFVVGVLLFNHIEKTFMDTV